MFPKTMWTLNGMHEHAIWNLVFTSTSIFFKTDASIILVRWNRDSKIGFEFCCEEAKFMRCRPRRIQSTRSNCSSRPSQLEPVSWGQVLQIHTYRLLLQELPLYGAETQLRSHIETIAQLTLTFWQVAAFRLVASPGMPRRLCTSLQISHTNKMYPLFTRPILLIDNFDKQFPTANCRGSSQLHSGHSIAVRVYSYCSLVCSRNNKRSQTKAHER